MKNAFAMKKLKTQKHASHEELSLIFCEFAMLSEVISEISTLHDVNHEVKIFSILESIVHVDQEAIILGLRM